MVPAAYYVGGLRRIAAAALMVAMAACAPAGVSPSAHVTSQVSPAQTAAAGLVTRLAVLLSEPAYLFAKESEAAVLQLPDYAGYVGLVQANEDDAANVMREAFGNTAATTLSASWQAVDADLVQYAVAVAGHDAAKVARAASDLDGNAVPALVAAFSKVTGVPGPTLGSLLGDWSRATRAMADDAVAQRFDRFQQDIATAFADGDRWSALASHAIVSLFPDKYPGDPSQPAVQQRAALNLALLEHAYLVSMATDATVANRGAARSAAFSALTRNQKLLLADAKTADPASLSALWTARIDALLAYAARGDPASRSAITDDFVARFSALTRAPRSTVAEQAAAALKVIDDQRAQGYDVLPGDDRAAAMAMQPLADALAGELGP